MTDGPAPICPDCGKPKSARRNRCYHCRPGYMPGKSWSNGRRNGRLQIDSLDLSGKSERRPSAAPSVLAPPVTGDEPSPEELRRIEEAKARLFREKHLDLMASTDRRSDREIWQQKANREREEAREERRPVVAGPRPPLPSPRPEAPDVVPHGSSDPELTAIAECLAVLKRLNGSQSGRVLDYLKSRLSATSSVS